jgi:hypothetical protein
MPPSHQPDDKMLGKGPSTIWSRANSRATPSVFMMNGPTPSEGLVVGA